MVQKKVLADPYNPRDGGRCDTKDNPIDSTTNPTSKCVIHIEPSVNTGAAVKWMVLASLLAFHGGLGPSGSLCEHVFVLPITDDQDPLAAPFSHDKLKPAIRRIDRDERGRAIVVLP